MSLMAVMIADALKQAKSHDEHQERTGATLGPLHGIPFTLKDMFNVKGYDSSLGVSKCVDKPYQSSSTLYETLTKLGAILLAKTNVPQTLLSFECNNPIFGPTQNPYVKGFTCGGSSGGEAAVLAKNGSALGFGTDIGGSLRIPTGWCGVYALKPTRGRFTSRGLNSKNSSNWTNIRFQCRIRGDSCCGWTNVSEYGGSDLFNESNILPMLKLILAHYR